MRSYFKIEEYFKGTDYDPFALPSYSGTYLVPYTYAEGKLEIIESRCRLAMRVPNTVYKLFKRAKKLRTMLWTERSKPCSPYVDVVEWLL